MSYLVASVTCSTQLCACSVRRARAIVLRHCSAEQEEERDGQWALVRVLLWVLFWLRAAAVMGCTIHFVRRGYVKLEEHLQHLARHGSWCKLVHGGQGKHKQQNWSQNTGSWSEQVHKPQRRKWRQLRWTKDEGGSPKSRSRRAVVVGKKAGRRRLELGR